MNSNNSTIKIGIGSFVIDNERLSKTRKNLPQLVSVINRSEDLDIIFFSGFALYDEKDIIKLQDKLTNITSLIIIETYKGGNGRVSEDKFYIFKNGKAIDKDISQIFGNSSEIKGNYELMDEYLNHLENERKIMFKNKVLRLVICGEINVVRNEQGNGNLVKFRLDDDKELSERFEKIYKGTDIFINPTHSQMGNQGKLGRRREYFSKGKKIFCSSSNFELSAYRNKYGIEDDTDIDFESKLLNKSIQYCFYDGLPVEAKLLMLNDLFIFKSYTIPVKK